MESLQVFWMNGNTAWLFPNCLIMYAQTLSTLTDDVQYFLSNQINDGVALHQLVCN